MELDLTTNTNTIFLYPLSQQRNPGTRTPPTPSRTNSYSSSLALSPQTSRLDSTSNGVGSGSGNVRPTSSFFSPASSSSIGSNGSSPNGSVSRINLLSEENLEEIRLQDSAHSSPVLFVTVHLTVPPKTTPPKMIQSLVVTVTSIEALSFPKGRYEQYSPFTKKVPVTQAAGTPLSSGGIYRWEIMVPIPHTTPPYERTKWGSVRQRVTAKMTFSGLLSRNLSVDKPLAFITAPTKDSTESFGWSRTHCASTAHLGPFFIALRTQHLTVGGFLRAALVLPSPRPTLNLVSFSVKVIQQVQIRSRENVRYSESCLPTQVEFLKATGDELNSASGEPIEKAWVVRLPDCNRIRPSTIKGSEAALTVTHNIEVHISFLDKPFPSEKVNPSELDEFGRRLYHYRVSWFITLPSCVLQWRSFRLPAYSVLDSDPVPATSRVFFVCEQGNSMKWCTCGESFESLLSYECEAELDLFTSALIQEEIDRFRLISGKHVHLEHAISGGTGFVYENLEGEVLEETDVERKCRLQREKEMNEYAAVEDGSGEPGVMLRQGPRDLMRDEGTIFKV